MIHPEEKVASPDEGVFPSSYSLFEILLVYSFAKDVHFFCQKLHPEQEIDAHELFTTLAIHQRCIGEVIVSEFFSVLKDKLSTTRKKLEQCGIGDALTIVESPAWKLMKDYKRKLPQHIQGNYLTAIILGYQLFRVILPNIKQIVIEKIEAAKNGRKLTESNSEQIDAICMAFDNDKEFIQMQIPFTKIGTFLQAQNEILQRILEHFDLKEVYAANLAFRELMKVNETFNRVGVTEVEWNHLHSLFKLYFQEKEQKVSSDIIKMMGSLYHIKPVFDLTCEDLALFMGSSGFSGRGNYIKRYFEPRSAQIYRTFEGLGLATVAYEEANHIMSELIERFEAQKKDKLVEQISQYKDCFANYFQLSMRIVMPLDEFIKLTKRILEKIAAKQADISKMMESLITWSDLLSQKAPGIKILADINKLKNKAVLFEVCEYFQSISQPSTHTDPIDYEAIFEKLTNILENHEINQDRQSAEPLSIVRVLNEFIKFTKDILERMDLGGIHTMVVSLTGCGDLLRQKTLSVNALTDMIKYSRQMEQILLQDEKPAASFLSSSFNFLRQPPPSDNYKKALYKVFKYFQKISQSSTHEGYTNYQAIFEKLTKILNDRGINLDKPSAKPKPTEALLTNIYQRYKESLEKYQNENSETASRQSDGPK